MMAAGVMACYGILLVGGTIYFNQWFSAADRVFDEPVHALVAPRMLSTVPFTIFPSLATNAIAILIFTIIPSTDEAQKKDVVSANNALYKVRILVERANVARLITNVFAVVRRVKRAVRGDGRDMGGWLSYHSHNRWWPLVVLLPSDMTHSSIHNVFLKPLIVFPLPPPFDFTSAVIPVANVQILSKKVITRCSSLFHLQPHYGWCGSNSGVNEHLFIL